MMLLNRVCGILKFRVPKSNIGTRQEKGQILWDRPFAMLPREKGPRRDVNVGEMSSTSKCNAWKCHSWWPKTICLSCARQCTE